MKELIERTNRIWERLGFPSLMADEFKTIYESRFVRFHSLPNAKRYPETESEYLALLARHNSVMTKVLKDAEILILVTGFDSDDFDVDTIGSLVLWRTFDLGQIFVVATTINSKMHEAVARLVADDRIANVMIISPYSDYLFHPYDGGIDVICPSPQGRDELKACFADWLP